MRMCPNCKIKVGGDLEHCPLCQNELQGEAGEPIYPKEIYIKKQPFIYKLQMHLTITAMIVSLALDFMVKLHKNIHWSFFVLIWGIGGQFLAKGLLRRHACPTQIISSSVTWLIIMVSPTLLILGFKDIYVLYVLPGILSLSMVLNFIFTMVDRKKNAFAYIIGNCVIALVVSIIFLCLVKSDKLIWAVCWMLSLVFLTAMGIFHGKKTMSELRRRLNM